MNGEPTTFEDIPKVVQENKGAIRNIVFIVIFVLFAFGAFTQIETEEVGIVTRFGKYSRQLEPGLNFKLPLIDKVYKVPVERQQKLEFGFTTLTAGIKTDYTRSRENRDEALMLTGDLNLADVEWVVQYRISNPYNYLFKVRNPKFTLRDIAEAATRQIVGDRTVNEVLTTGRIEIASQLEELIQKICKEYSLGIEVEQVVLQNVNPPESVKAAFNEVNEAQQEKERLIYDANSEYNSIIPKARGQALETVQKAEGYATERVNRALGEVARFNDLYKEYVKAPEVTKRRIYLETMEEVLPNLGNKIITDDEGNNVLPLLQMQLKN
ncbi:MAG: FtsH protease activity modulator HflK [Bacteroidales bacterium]|nr:FtsH protease activity modulator HflK [Bacteroidales bacterium]